MIFPCCGPAKNDNGNNAGGADVPEPAKTTLAGTYFAEYDISSMVAAAIEGQYDIDITTPLIMDLFLTLNEDNTFELGIDAEQFIANTEAFYYQIFPSMLKSIYAESGITSDADIESIIVNNWGYASMDEYLKELVDQSMVEVRSQYEASDEVMKEGTYTVNGNKLELTLEGFSSATDSGVINSDGTITMERVEVEGEFVDITFSK